MLKSFCLGCRHEKDNKNKEPCSTTCQARVYYTNLVENPAYIVPNEFLRGNDMITLAQLADSIADPNQFRKRLKKTPEKVLKQKRSKSSLGRKVFPSQYSYSFNSKLDLPEGYKDCPDCPPEDNPLPLDNFSIHKRGFRGRQVRCKIHHRLRYYKYVKKGEQV